MCMTECHFLLVAEAWKQDDGARVMTKKQVECLLAWKSEASGFQE
jgi:hypothetical protein